MVKAEIITYLQGCKKITVKLLYVNKKLFIVEIYNMEYYFKVLFDDIGERVDVYLSKKLGRSRQYCKFLIESKQVSLCDVNNSIKPSYHVKLDDNIYVKIPEEKAFELKSQPIEVNIIFENSRYFVINKTSGLVVHPAYGNYDNTLVNALLGKLSQGFSSEDIRPGIIHRLDKDTSGVMVVAKDALAKDKLAALFKSRLIKKIYHAICFGEPKDDFFVINAPIARHPKLRKLMAVVTNGKEAISEVKVRNRYKGAFLAEIELKTGRTHQIRVHMKYAGHPVVGDKVYSVKGSLDFPIERQALHAYSLEFIDPFSGELKTFIAEYQKDFLNLINLLTVKSKIY